MIMMRCVCKPEILQQSTLYFSKKQFPVSLNGKVLAGTILGSSFSFHFLLQKAWPSRKGKIKKAGTEIPALPVPARQDCSFLSAPRPLLPGQSNPSKGL